MQKPAGACVRVSREVIEVYVHSKRQEKGPSIDVKSANVSRRVPRVQYVVCSQLRSERHGIATCICEDLSTKTSECTVDDAEFLSILVVHRESPSQEARIDLTDLGEGGDGWFGLCIGY